MPSLKLPVSTPRLRALRWTTDTLNVSIKEHPVITRVESGRFESFAAGQVFRSEPGCIHVKQPGDVHRELDRDGPGTYTIVVLPDEDVAWIRDEGRAVVVPHFTPGDERARPLHRLVDAVVANADRLTLEVTLVEAVGALAQLSQARALPTRPVRRAVEYLRERLVDSISLDELAAYADRDKFYLCRAFRAQVGLPPHAYLTHLRVARAKALLERGVRASEAATRSGFYDQAQLTRHFRRIVGTTPARYARARPRGRAPETAVLDGGAIAPRGARDRSMS